MTQKAFRVTGTEKIARELKKMKFTALPLRRFMNDYAEIIAEEAKKQAPKATGELANSIEAGKVKDRGRLPNSIKVSSNVPYDVYVHGRYKKLPAGYKKPPAKRRANATGFPRTRPHRPPFQPIEDWVRTKGLDFGNGTNRTAGTVSGGIAKRGTPIVPYLLLAEKNTRKQRKVLLARTMKEIQLAWKLGTKL